MKINRKTDSHLTRVFEVKIVDYPESFLQFFGLLIHTADLYSSTKPREISLKWVELINAEFTDQYNEEVAKGYKVSTFFANLNVPLVKAKGESFFISTFILPLWKLLDNILEGSLEEEIKYIQDNLEYWKAKAKEEEAKKLEAEK